MPMSNLKSQSSDVGYSREVTMESKAGNQTQSRQQTRLTLTRQPTEKNLESRTSKKRGSLAIKNLEEELKKSMPKGWNIRPGFQPLEHFRKHVKFVIVFTKWIMALREEAEKSGGAGSAAITGFANQDVTSSLITTDGDSFDLKNYQSKKEILLSSDVREILNQHPTLRTKEQVQLAKYGLQHVKSFSEYPLHMQEKLATVAYFEQIDAKRVIIREGHTAENFYFILSGSARCRRLVNELDQLADEENKNEVLLAKGESFGELELLHHSKRQMTVVSATPMSLLRVGRDNFFKIFMHSPEDSSLPEHVKFLSTLEVMKGFPIQKLVENPEKCLLHFFRRGTVIVNDSTNCEWLYVIKSGSCEVLKAVKSLHTKQSHSDAAKAVPASQSLGLPSLGTGPNVAKVDSGIKHLPPISFIIPLSKKQKKGSASKSNSTLDYDYLSKDDDNLPLLQLEKRLTEDDDFKTRFEEIMDNLNVPMDLTTPHRNSIRNKSNVGFTKSSFHRLAAIKKRSQPQMVLSTPAYAVDMPARKAKVKFDDDIVETMIQDKEETEVKDSNKHGLILEKNSMGSMNTDVRPADRMEPNYAFILVDHMKPRDMFGLANIKFDQFLENRSPTVSLVSRGAECIMIEKKFFIEHSPHVVKHNVMTLVRTYPDSATLRSNLQIKESWDDYRDNVYKTSKHNAAKRKEHQKKSFSVY